MPELPIPRHSTPLSAMPDDLAALAAAIANLLTNRAYARQMAERGRLDVRERYDANRLALQNLDVYRSLLAGYNVVDALSRSPRRA